MDNKLKLFLIFLTAFITSCTNSKQFTKIKFKNFSDTNEYCLVNSNLELSNFEETFSEIIYNTTFYKNEYDNEIIVTDWPEGPIYLLCIDRINCEVYKSVKLKNGQIHEVNMSHFSTYKLNINSILSKYEKLDVCVQVMAKDDGNDYSFCFTSGKISNDELTINFIEDDKDYIIRFFAYRDFDSDMDENFSHMYVVDSVEKIYEEDLLYANFSSKTGLLNIRKPNLKDYIFFRKRGLNFYQIFGM